MRSVRFSVQRQRSLALLLGLLAVSMGVLLVASASQTTLIVADRELRGNWRTTYDILVRPIEARSPTEGKYGLVEANHLSGLWGGITFEQYEVIKAIPGVEVAAPIAMIGYTAVGVSAIEGLVLPDEPGVYVLAETVIVDDGGSRHIAPEFPRRTYLYSGPAPTRLYLDRLIANPSPVLGSLTVPIFLAGIDPSQEVALVALDQAVVEGQYLRGDESLELPFTLVPAGDAEVTGVPSKVISVPSLINAATYISLTYQVELKRMILPPEVTVLDDILTRGGPNYLDTLSTQPAAVTIEMNSGVVYRSILESIGPSPGTFEGRQGAWGAMRVPGALAYSEADPPAGYHGLTLSLQLPEQAGDPAQPQFRAASGAEETRTFNVTAYWDVKGIFNIEGLPKPADVSRVPLETYFPPVALVRYDEQGQPVDPPRELRPTLNPAGYVQPPPLILTTLEAARALRGDAAISAIRVRVTLEGCPASQPPEACPMTPQAQRKIEAIAIEIASRTGLTVDVMVGSSPARVLVHVPGIGYVEEQWIQKGVNLVYTQGIRTGNWLLLITLLAAGGLYTLDLSWAEVVARRRLIALQKALGWRSRTVFAQTLGQVLRIGAAAVVTGTLGALGIMRRLNWQSLPDWLLLGLPLAVLGVAALGSLTPAWLASRVPPIVELQRGGLRYRRGRKSGLALGLWAYAGSNLLRRPGRVLLTGLTAMLSAALLVLLLATTFDQRSMLSGTLLGEFILVRVERFHYAMVGIGLVLAALSTIIGLLGSIVERRREIGVLKATGWRTRSVAGLFVREGTLLGLAGGALGTLLGSLAYLYLYRVVSAGLAAAILVGVSVPGLVGALAALYPAHVAAGVPPAEAVRYE